MVAKIASRFAVNYLFVFAALFFFSQSAFAIVTKAPTKTNFEARSILKADEVFGDQENQTVNAVGNAELLRDNNVVYADEMSYDKKKSEVRAIGNVRIKNIELGIVNAKEAAVKDDFRSGTFFDSVMIMNDGSYMISPKVERLSPHLTVFNDSIYSICPNPEISPENQAIGKERDLLSIKSKELTIDRGNEFFRMRSGVIRFYDVPVFYTPYFRTALPGKERKSGFLAPSYIKSTRFGLGLKLPYYLNIAEDKDLLVTSQINPSTTQFILNNQYRQMMKYGDFKTNLELANNQIVPNGEIVKSKRSTKDYRWFMGGEGKFNFDQNSGFEFELNNASDPNYLRDYYNKYGNFLISKANLDYVDGRSYHSIKMIKLQEMENSNSSTFVMPKIDSHIETKKGLLGAKFVLNSNFSAIKSEHGGYRRATAIPEINLPINIQGNLIKLKAKVQGDFYSLTNFYNQDPAQLLTQSQVNFTNYDISSISTAGQNFRRSGNALDRYQANYKPELSLSWGLPFMKKSKSYTIVVEPMINFVHSSYSRNYKEMANVDSNNSQLTINSLFVNDRVSGFDRSEIGDRVSYGVNTSWFNSYGQFGLNIGQSQRIKDRQQDVLIRGFGEKSISNVVGEMSYKAKKYFSIYYFYQLNSVNYRNDVNEVSVNFDNEVWSISNYYLLLRRSLQNLERIEQNTLYANYKLSDKWKLMGSISKNMTTGRNVFRRVGFGYGGCCAAVDLTITEYSPSNLIRAQRNFSVTVTFKNL